MTDNALYNDSLKITAKYELKEESEQQDELRSSTTASNLNKSIDNLSPHDMIKSGLGNIFEFESKRKLSAPLSNVVGLNISKLGKGTRGSYYNKLFCKGFIN